MSESAALTAAEVTDFRLGPGPVTLVAGPGAPVDAVNAALGRCGEKVSEAVRLEDAPSASGRQALMVCRLAEEVCAEALRRGDDQDNALEAWRVEAMRALEYLHSRRRHVRLVLLRGCISAPRALETLLARPVSVREPAPADDDRDLVFTALGALAVAESPTLIRLERELGAAIVPLTRRRTGADLARAADLVRRYDLKTFEALIAENASERGAQLMVEELRAELSRQVRDQKQAEKNVADLTRERDKARAERDWFSRALKDMRAEKERLDGLQQTLTGEVSTLLSQIESIHRSKSWYFTKPVRAIGRLMRRLRGQA